MSQYIDADLITQYFNQEEWYTPDEKWWPEREIGMIVNSIPKADVVEVVRCKECSNRMKDMKYCTELDRDIHLDNYCSFAERREEQQ